MTRLLDPQHVALNVLIHARQHYAHGIASLWSLEHVLGSRENVWQVIHRLRLAGHKIRTHKCPRGDRTRGGYQLQRLAAESRLGFELLGAGDPAGGLRGGVMSSPIMGGGIIARED